MTRFPCKWGFFCKDTLTRFSGLVLEQCWEDSNNYWRMIWAEMFMEIIRGWLKYDWMRWWGAPSRFETGLEEKSLWQVSVDRPPMEADGSERDSKVDCSREEGETVARWGAHLVWVVVLVVITRWQNKMTRWRKKMTRWMREITRWRKRWHSGWERL